MNNNEINPKLKKQLQSLQDIPSRGLQQSHIGKEKFLSQAKDIQTRPAPKQIRKTRGAVPLRRSWVPRLAGILAVLLIALFSVGGTVYAAQGSLPDDFLYPVKTLTEDIQVSLESDPQDRLDLYTLFASRRLQEIQAQIEAGEEVSEKAMALLDKHTNKMLEEAAQVGEKGLQNALRQIEENLQKQNQMMEKLQKQTPGSGAPGLINAQEKLRERLELVENGIDEPQGFQETMKERKEKTDPPGQEKDNGNSNKPETPPGQENKGNNGQGNGSK
ncbi:MAG: DUF5667 domain-containing protein [Anaerolineales bacterium]|nr:DUF5667 domain-containing protein [Anaerolineales bacterium]